MNKIRFIAHAAKRLLDNKALYAQLLVTRDCNLSCAYCNEYTPGSPHVPLAELMQRIDKLNALGVLVYDVLGGEPLMHADLAALIAHIKAKRNGNNLVTLISNGFLLTEDIIRALNQAGLDMLQLSVDSVRPGSQSMKSLKSLLPKLHLLKRHACFTVKVQTVLTPETAAEYDAFREMLEDFPFAFSFSFLHQAGGQIAITGQEFVALFDRHQLWGGMRLYREDARALLQGDFSRPWKCLGGCKFLYVNVNGHIQWCSQQKGSDIALLQASTSDLHAAHIHKPCEKACALGCARLISHALGQPVKTLSASLSVLKIIPERKSDA